MFRLPACFAANLYIAWLPLLPLGSSSSGLLRCCLPGSPKHSHQIKHFSTFKKQKKKVKEEIENAGLKLNIQKTKIMASGPISSIQFSSVAQSCLTLCNPMNRSTPGFPVHHQLQEFTQTHVHWVGDTIQSSHPLSFPSPLAFSISQHQSLFNKPVLCINDEVLEFQLQHQSFQWIFRIDFL